MRPVVLTDIEGTISDIDFVRNVLFPYARDAIPGFIAEHGNEPGVAAQIAAAAAEAGLDPADRRAVVAQLLAWIEEDVKATPLKALQGMVWRAGYESGAFTAHLYDDAHRWLAKSREEGVPLYVYSSGSVEAQELYFAHTTFGDLLHWFEGFFDTRTGHKRDADSYRRIAASIGVPAASIVFFSDVLAELDAAAEAGMQTFLLDRAGTLGNETGHPRHATFDTIDLESHA